MYMDGKGIMRRTERLNTDMKQKVDALWDSLGMAFIGLSMALVGLLLSWGPILLPGAPWQPPSTWHLAIAIAVTAFTVPVGIWLSLPWFRAERALKQHIKIVEAHTAAMKRERAKRGPGWAKS